MKTSKANTKKSKVNLRTTKSMFLIFACGSLLLASFQNCAKHEINAKRGGLRVSEQLALVGPQAASILNSQCASCHHAQATDTVLLALDEDSLVALNAIDPGFPENSKIYLDIIDGYPHIKQGTLPTVSAVELNIIKNWIQLLGGFGDDEDVFAP